MIEITNDTLYGKSNNNSTANRNVGHLLKTRVIKSNAIILTYLHDVGLGTIVYTALNPEYSIFSSDRNLSHKYRSEEVSMGGKLLPQYLPMRWE